MVPGSTGTPKGLQERSGAPFSFTGVREKHNFRAVSDLLASICSAYNFRVAPTFPIGRPGKLDKTTREFRLQIVDIKHDTTAELKAALVSALSIVPGITEVTLNELSPNSSKFSSVGFEIDKVKYDAVVARGVNAGESFEREVIVKLREYVEEGKKDPLYTEMLRCMAKANRNFKLTKLVSVRARTGSTKKTGVSLDQLGAVIADAILVDSTGKEWFVSLKSYNGETFSSFPGASTVVDAHGTVNNDRTAPGVAFLDAFGVDLNKVQQGLDYRHNRNISREQLPVFKPDQRRIKAIFEHGWGMTYFYVKRGAGQTWKVFWLDRAMLNKLTDNIRVDRIEYPSPASKQISIRCSNSFASYLITMRNSQGAERFNDCKLRIMKLNL